MDEKNFALRLARLREMKGVSARDMSLSIGQNPGYINSIESGKALPSMAMFFCICEYLYISPAEFFALENNSPQKTQNIIQNLSKLDDETLNSINILVEKLANK